MLKILCNFSEELKKSLFNPDSGCMCQTPCNELVTIFISLDNMTAPVVLMVLYRNSSNLSS